MNQLLAPTKLLSEKISEDIYSDDMLVKQQGNYVSADQVIVEFQTRSARQSLELE